MSKLNSTWTLMLLCSLSCAPVVFAQATVQESLIIGPGDLVHVQFYDTPELEQHPHVDDAGNAPLLFLGPTPVAGKTPDQAAQLIAALMVSRNFMSHPQVVVSIEQYATQGVTISGEVEHAGNFAIATPRDILDVLALAGGLNAFADRHIVVQRRGASSQRISYFVSNHPEEQLAARLMIHPGDVILVPRVGFVYILGDVGRPGGYPLSNNDTQVTLLQALANAGSPNKTAVLSGIKLMRKSGEGYNEVQIHPHKIESGKEPDPVLLADDVVIVPFSYAKNFILNGTSIAASLTSAALYTR